MPSTFNKKAKTINVNLTQDEYNKIQKLAEIRHLNPTSYTKQVALGNRIKPTVIEYPQEQTTLDDYNDSNDSNEIIEQLKKDNEALKSDKHALQQRNDQLEDDIEQFKQENDVFHRLLEHFDSTAFMNFHTYRDDELLKNAIKRLKE